VSRAPGPDDGREEAYLEGGSAEAPDGPIIRHRYAPEAPPEDEKRAERLARRKVMQEGADAGRVVHGVPWLGWGQRQLKVQHRRWEREPNGWHRCKRCGFPAISDEARILHQAEHTERARVLQLQAADAERADAERADMQAQIDLMAEELARDRYRFTALCLALGKPDEEAMQEAVDFVLSYAREVNARRQKGDD
jgi:hypothetical protein